MPFPNLTKSSSFEKAAYTAKSLVLESFGRTLTFDRLLGNTQNICAEYYVLKTCSYRLIYVHVKAKLFVAHVFVFTYKKFKNISNVDKFAASAPKCCSCVQRRVFKFSKIMQFSVMTLLLQWFNPLPFPQKNVPGPLSIASADR